MLSRSLLEDQVQLRFSHSSIASLQCFNPQHAQLKEYLPYAVDRSGRLWATSDARVSQKFCANHRLHFNLLEDDSEVICSCSRFVAQHQLHDYLLERWLLEMENYWVDSSLSFRDFGFSEEENKMVEMPITACLIDRAQL